MITLDEMIDNSNGMVPEAVAYSFLKITEDEMLKAFEFVLEHLSDVQNFAQLRKGISEQKESISQLIADRKRAREILESSKDV